MESQGQQDVRKLACSRRAHPVQAVMSITPLASGLLAASEQTMVLLCNVLCGLLR